MTEKWDWEGPPDNIHVFQVDDPNMRVCFMTSDGPTEQRARLIAAAPEMAEAIDFLLKTMWGTDASRAAVESARAALAKARGEA